MYDFDLQKLGGKDIVLLGETHGVKENLEVIKEFIVSFEKWGFAVNVGLEWPVGYTADIDKFLHTTQSAPPWNRWTSLIENEDGRISKEHIDFLQWLKQRNLTLSQEKKHDLFCFSEYHQDWNVRELAMAHNIIASHQGKYQDVTLAIMGSLHACKVEIVFDGDIHKPLATNLPGDDTVAFKCIYQGGTFFNHSLRSVGSELPSTVEAQK